MRLAFLPRLANQGTMVAAALAVALLIAAVYERNLYGTLQYVAAFAFYLAVMVLAIPVATSLRDRRWLFGHGHWLPLVFALAYAANAISVGRGRVVLMLAVAGLVVGLLVALLGIRSQRELQRHPD